MQFEHVGGLNTGGYDHSVVISGLKQKKEDVAFLLRHLLFIAQEPIQIWQSVLVAEADICNNKEIRKYEKGYRLDQFMHKRKQEGVYLHQMQMRINALKYLYAKKIYAFNYLYDFDIFVTCDCIHCLDDTCPKNLYVDEYVYNLFENPDYVESIRRKIIDIAKPTMACTTCLKYQQQLYKNLLTLTLPYELNV